MITLVKFTKTKNQQNFETKKVMRTWYLNLRGNLEINKQYLVKKKQWKQNFSIEKIIIK